MKNNVGSPCTEEEKYSSPVRTKGRSEAAKPSEKKTVRASDANATVEHEVPDGEEAAVEASESMEIVLHISEDEGDKTDVEAAEEILLDGKIYISVCATKQRL